MSLHAFTYTDYAFIREASLLSLASINNIQVVNLQSRLTETPSLTSLIFDLDNGDKSLSVHAELGGPSIITNFIGGFKVGLFSKLRANVSTAGISENFGVYELNDSFREQEINFKQTQVAGMIWREYGIHVSKSFGDWDAGINVKRLTAYEGFFAKVDTDQNVAYPNGVIQFGSNDLQGGLGFTRNGLYADNFNLLDTQDHGAGFTIDLGANFYINDLTIGVSILDLGYLSFQNHVENYALPDNYTDFDVDPNDYVDIRSLKELIDQVEEDTPFAPFFDHKEFNMGAPTAINISADYPINEKYFVSASLTQRLKILNVSTVSDNALSIVPRYQSKWLSAYLPVTLYNYAQVRLGAAARFAYLTIGSDDVMSVFRKTDFRGSDVYIKLSVTPLFKIKRRSRSGSKQSGSDAKCYEF